MKTAEITHRMARQAGVTRAEAADQLDRAVHQILTSLRAGRPSPLPGLGRFIRDARGRVTFEQEPRRRG